jgi:hypothetical protein
MFLLLSSQLFENNSKKHAIKTLNRNKNIAFLFAKIKKEHGKPCSFI